MAKVKLIDVCKVYKGNVKAVKDFNLEIKDGEFLVFVGPSGCGKSTTLRMVAGLEDITSGKIYIDDKFINDLEPKDRDIAMVFQNYALYPHMSVYDNLAYSLNCHHVDKNIIKEKVEEVAKMLDIEEYLLRKPKELSGGQRQRVALGRCLIRSPKVFLFDEPLSNLDAKLRVSMRSEISKLHKKVNGTFIYVTHDQTEAMTMGDRIVVMKDGVIMQNDTPQVLYNHPQNMFVAGFIGSPQMNFFEGKLTGTKDKVYVEFGLEKILLPKDKIKLIVNLDKYLNTDKEIVFGVRPEDFHDEDVWVKDSKKEKISITVDVVEALGSETLLYCKTRTAEAEKDISEKSIDEDMHNMIAKVDSRSKSKAGEKIDIAINLDHCHIFDKETEITILARDEENKAEIEALQAKRAQEQAEKAAVNAAKKAENEAKLAAEAEKQRAKMEKKLAKKAVKEDVKEEVAEEVEPNVVVEKLVVEEEKADKE